MRSSTPSYGRPFSLLLLGLLLLAALPLLYLFQLAVHRSRGLPSLQAELQVAVNGQAPTRLDLSMIPSTEPPALPGGLRLQGQGRHRALDFPWRPEPFEGRLVLELNREIPGSGDYRTEDGDLLAWYGEHYLHRPGKVEEVPCSGGLDLRSLRLRGRGRLLELPRLERFLGLLELECSSPARGGPRWELRGRLRLAWSGA